MYKTRHKTQKNKTDDNKTPTADTKRRARTLVTAIRTNDTSTLPDIINHQDVTSLLNTPAQKGACAERWAYWLHNSAVLSALNLPTGTLRVFSDGIQQTLDAQATQTRFAFEPILYPRFESSRGIGVIISYLRILFKCNFFKDSCLWHAAQHKQQLTHAAQTPHVVQFIDDTLGHGVIAQKNLSAGDFVGEYLGEINLRHIFSPFRDTTYIMDYPIPMPPGYRWSIDARRSGNFTRFINHDDNANCHMAVAYDGFIFRLLVLAKRDISSGEEFRLNYGKNYWRNRHLARSTSAQA